MSETQEILNVLSDKNASVSNEDLIVDLSEEVEVIERQQQTNNETKHC